MSWLLLYLFWTDPWSSLRGCFPGYSPQKHAKWNIIATFRLCVFLVDISKVTWNIYKVSCLGFSSSMFSLWGGGGAPRYPFGLFFINILSSCDSPVLVKSTACWQLTHLYSHRNFIFLVSIHYLILKLSLGCTCPELWLCVGAVLDPGMQLQGVCGSGSQELPTGESKGSRGHGDRQLCGRHRSSQEERLITGVSRPGWVWNSWVSA